VSMCTWTEISQIVFPIHTAWSLPAIY